MEHLELLEYSAVFSSNPEYRILFQNNLLHMLWPKIYLINSLGD